MRRGSCAYVWGGGRSWSATGLSDSTGKGLLDAFLEKAIKLQLELSDCRGQSYDNGANMKGKHSGVQARMLDINPKAVYVPCANHTLNLVVVDSAN